MEFLGGAGPTASSRTDRRTVRPSPRPTVVSRAGCLLAFRARRAEAGRGHAVVMPRFPPSDGWSRRSRRGSPRLPPLLPAASRVASRAAPRGTPLPWGGGLGSTLLPSSTVPTNWCHRCVDSVPISSPTVPTCASTGRRREGDRPTAHPRHRPADGATVTGRRHGRAACGHDGAACNAGASGETVQS